MSNGWGSMNLPREETTGRELPNRDMPDLQAGLLRHSLDAYAQTRDRCSHCDRSPLAGEQIFVCDGERIVCGLCISLEPNPPRVSRLVHGTEVGRTIQIVDRRCSQGRPAGIRART
ncbi:MAG: hypothetical protein JO342_10700 [Solirubrobacterales bacterium]|nr:hypothetical protein [Solirubrobacterales bacterium]